MMGEDEKVKFLLDHLTGRAKDKLRIRVAFSKNTTGKIVQLLKDLFQDSDNSTNTTVLLSKGSKVK